MMAGNCVQFIRMKICFSCEKGCHMKRLWFPVGIGLLYWPERHSRPPIGSCSTLS